MNGLEHYDEELQSLEERLRRLALACGADCLRIVEQVDDRLARRGFPSPNNPTPKESA